MSKDSKWISTIIAMVFLSIVIMIFPIAMDGISNALSTSQADAGVGVVNTGGSGTMTLSQRLYDDNVLLIASVTSSSGTDTPVASSYVGATDVLTVTGLSWAGTRTLTTTYIYSSTDDYAGLKDIMEATPLILWVIIIFGSGVVTIFAVRAKTKKG